MEQIHRTRQQAEDAMWREAFGIIARCIALALVAAALVTWSASGEPPTDRRAVAHARH